MKKSDVREALRQHRIINTYDVLKRFGSPGLDVMIHYVVPVGRSAHVHRTLVSSVTFKVDPRAHFSDHFAKAFVGYRNESMPAAREWATKTFGISNWVPCPTDRRTLIPEYVYIKVLHFVSKQQAAAESDKEGAPL